MKNLKVLYVNDGGSLTRTRLLVESSQDGLIAGAYQEPIELGTVTILKGWADLDGPAHHAKVAGAEYIIPAYEIERATFH